MTPPNLSAEEIAEWKRQANNGELSITQQLHLLAMASRLLEVESALRFVAAYHGLSVMVPREILWPTDRFLRNARQFGWPGATSKPEGGG